jgi:hypothetical protein
MSPGAIGDTTCLVNIGPKERRKRFVLGAVVLALTFAATPLFLDGSLPRGAALGLAVPVWFGLLGVLQALQKT